MVSQVSDSWMVEAERFCVVECCTVSTVAELMTAVLCGYWIGTHKEVPGWSRR